MPTFDLIAAACPSRSRSASAQALVNLYPEQTGQSITLYGTPGKSLWATIGNGPIRGGIVVDGFAYIASGREVYKVTDLGVGTLLGSLGTGYGRVYMASNGVDILIVDGASGYTITAGVLAEITDADFPRGVTCCDYVDGFYLVAGDDTQKFYKSAALSGSSWDALDFASAEGDPDTLVRLIVSSREILNFGGKSLEFWANTGAAGFPFERSGNAFVEQGCAAPHSVAKLDSSVFWLGRSGQGEGIVWRLNGYTPTRISTHAIEYEIASWSDISDAYAWSYVEEGHAFYALSSASGDITLVYDVASGQWHQRRSRDGKNVLHRDRGGVYLYFLGRHLLGDWENGNIYRSSLDTYSDNGDELPRIIRGEHLRAGKRRFYGQFEAYFETGVGLQSGQGSDPQAVLSVSDDGGRTFHSAASRAIGAVGKYQGRVMWTRLGSGFSRTFQIEVTDPVKVAITGARVEFTE